ncbi:MAG: hypothetical protein ABGX16_15530 [Pirellulales bacterium]
MNCHRLPWIHSLLLMAVVTCMAIVGCSQKSQVPTGKPAENIRKLALAYVQSSSTNRGIGPKDKQSLIKFMVHRIGLSEQEADKLFVSPRDNHPYVILWGIALEGSGPMGPRPPKPKIIAYEKSGADGTRYVADGRISIVQMSQEDFSKWISDQEN